MKRVSDYSKNVFINCPFDSEYDEMFNAILFTVHKCGFVLRCAKEFDGSNTIRIKNIIKLIRESQYSIHDLSRISLSQTSNLPRFNMPLELGICIGSIEFGNKAHKKKEYLIMESDKFRFKEFISDISGQDIRNHNNDITEGIRCIRDWLVRKTEDKIPSASVISKEYNTFLGDLPEMCRENDWVQNELTFEEYSSLVTSWLVATHDGESPHKANTRRHVVL